ncbi:MAG: transposase [Phycisphaerae bacterium]|nr:transposase [Phycisphaerae bacterium]
MVYHVLNRANGRLTLFKKDEDFLAFERALLETHQHFPLPVLAWCVMQNHWHFVVQPKEDGDLGRFFGRLALLHATRWQVAQGTVGMGHVYQGRFKNFMIQQDEHLLWVLRYVERNPLRANAVKRSQDWRWGSLHIRQRGPADLRSLLSDWPIDRPRNWIDEVNRPQSETEELAITNAERRMCPLGDEQWVKQKAKQHGLQSTLRPRGRQVGWRKRVNAGE